MHATKGGWFGQTFALANSNDSGGRKSRIRRSKEERKQMVESFIKRYQKSNNGSFPSLNLTHKEVGGSFYKVREIVREIIQENRVLGPPKFPPGEQNMDSFLEQNPLGSISVDPRMNVISSNETQVLLDHQYIIEEQVLDFRQIPEPHHGRLDNEKVFNGSTHATVRNEELEEPISTELLVKTGAEGERDEEKEQETYQANISQTAEGVIVETFPLRPVSNAVYDLDGKLSESEVVVEALEEKDIENMELEAGNNNNSKLDSMYYLKNSSEVVDKEAEADLSGPLPERTCILVGEKAEPTLESRNCSTTKESIGVDVKDSTDLEVKGTFLAGNKQPLNAPNGILAENINSNKTVSFFPQPTLKETITNKNKSSIQNGDCSQKKGNDPTLDRISLELWEATSEKSAGPKTNSIVAFIKAFIMAFMKFWSE